MPLIYDIETDGLLPNVSTIHCVAIYDTDADQTLVFNDQGSQPPISNAITMLDGADWVVGHNVSYYDNIVIQQFYPWFNPVGRTLDTLLLSRLTFPNLAERDYASKIKEMPTQKYGSHSLEAWGYRLGVYKDDFGKHTDWKSWSREMEDYMVQDVNVTRQLWNLFQKTYPSLVL